MPFGLGDAEELFKPTSRLSSRSIFRLAGHSIIFAIENALRSVLLLAFFPLGDHLLQVFHSDWIDFALSDFLGRLVVKLGAEKVPILNFLQHGAQLMRLWVIQQDERLFLGTVDSLELKCE